MNTTSVFTHCHPQLLTRHLTRIAVLRWLFKTSQEPAYFNSQTFTTIKQIKLSNCKSGIQKIWQRFEFHLKKSNMSQAASQKIQTSNLFNRRENCWTCAKKPAKLNNSDKGQLSLEQKRNKNNFGWYRQRFEFFEDSAIGYNFSQQGRAG